MLAGNHDTLVYRLAQILIKLNQGERLYPQTLADEFGVNIRTIQRDLFVRFAYLPLQKVDGYYHLEPSFLGKIDSLEIERFASLAGVHGLFPSLSDDFLRDIFDSRIQGALLVKGHNYENIQGKETLFRKLEQTIVENNEISFDYQKSSGSHHYEKAAPYKLINHHGIWYLAALESNKLKTFVFSKIGNVSKLNSKFSPDPNVGEMLVKDDGIWLNKDKIEVVLNISNEIAGYFKRRKLIANQVIEKELEDGGLIVSAKVGHLNQILPIVRYWIPHIRIISPDRAQQDMDTELMAYLNNNS